jgi:hypothetical protein
MYEIEKPDSFKVPPGEYSIFASARMMTAHMFVGVNIFSTKPVKIETDGTAEIKLGGKVGFVMEPGDEIITLKQGEEKDMIFRLTLGNDYTVTSYSPVIIEVKDASGKVLLSEEAEQGCIEDGPSPRYYYTLSVPKNWTPGDYTLVVKTELDPYQDEVAFEKHLKVIK